jgi:hypothetical protein
MGSHRTQFFLDVSNFNVYLCESCIVFRENVKPRGRSQRFVTSRAPLAFTKASLRSAKAIRRSIPLGRPLEDGCSMNSLARSNAHSNRSRLAAHHRHNSDLPGASTSLKSFIERKDGPGDVKSSRRLEESSEAAVIAAPAATAIATRSSFHVNDGDPVRRVPARTRSLRRGSSTRQGLHTQSLHGVPSSKPQISEAKAAAKESIMPARKRISITAKDFADLIAAPASNNTPCDEPVKLAHDLPRAVHDYSSAMGVLPPGYARHSGARRHSHHTSYNTLHDQVPSGPRPCAATLAGNHEQITQRSQSQDHKQNAGSAPFRRSSSDVGCAEREREQLDVRRTVSLDEIKVMDVPVLRRRSSVRDGRHIPSESLAEKGGSGHSRPPRQAPSSLYDKRPSYKEAEPPIPAGSDRSSLRSESLSSRKDDLTTLEFLESFSEFSELTDEWEPVSVRRAKSFDEPKIPATHPAAERRRPRFHSEDLTSPTERSSGLYSDSSRHYPRPPRQPGSNRGYSPCATPSSSGSTDHSAPHAFVQRGVTRRQSSSLQTSRHVPTLDPKLPSVENLDRVHF